MSRSSSKNHWRTLKRYALAGQTDAARDLLQLMLRENPEDKEAAAELARLKAGKALHITETPKERQQRLCQEAYQELHAVLGKYTPRSLSCLHTEELQSLNKDLQRHLRTLKEHNQAAPQGTNAYKKQLTIELKRRRKHNAKYRLRAFCILLALVLAAGGVFLTLQHRAAHLAAQLDAAWHAADWEKTDALLETADTGINRLVYSDMERLVSEVKKWQHHTMLSAQEISRQFVLYENLDAIADLSLQERSDFLRKVRALPAPFSKKLLTQWEELCRPEKEKLDKQRDAILADVSAATRLPALSGNPQQDLPLLKEAQKHIQQVTTTFAAAKEAFDLDPAIIRPALEALSQVEAHLSDLEKLARAGALLGTARSYDQHRQAVSDFTPTKHPTALAAQRTCIDMPGEEELHAEVRALRYKLPRHIPEHVLKAILEKGPSFCPAAPATSQQVHLMEDIFSSRTLRTKLFEVSQASEPTHYSEQYPSISEKNSVSFTISELDPAYRLGMPLRIERENPHSVWVRVLDPSPILKSTRISRDMFFLSANLPDLLGRITAIHDKDCPALAKAYVYHTLLELMHLHKTPEILGLRYAPTLREDIKSFRQLRTKYSLPLSATCWLSNDSASMAAELAYAKWFENHADRDYSAEMSKNLGQLLHVRPRYVGYVDEKRQPHLREQLQKDAALWYLSGKRWITTPAGKPLTNPAPFSPIFVE